MGDGADGQTAAGRKHGCLKWVLGGLAALLLAGLILLTVMWQGLSSWDNEATPWPHLPPQTLWAVHAHDLSTMGKTAFADNGVRALLQSLYAETPPNGAVSGWRSLIPANALDFYDYLGFLHKAVAPNIVMAGATSRDPDATFMIMYPPAWMRFLLNWSGEKLDEVQGAGSDKENPDWFFAERDGWLVSSSSREAVSEVLEGWDSGAHPLGTGSGRIDAHLYFAARTHAVPEKTENKSNEEAAAPAHFTLADPFAAALPPAPPVEEPEKPAVRLLLTPGAKEWNIQGEAGVRNGFQAGDFLFETVAKTLGGKAPALVPPGGCDVAAFARMADNVRSRLRREADEITGARDPSSSHPIRSLGARWIGESWLGNAGNDWVCLAAKPAAAGDGLPYPVLPVFSLGWTLREGARKDRAVKAFSDSLTHWVEAVRSPGGPYALQSLRNAISLERHGDKPEDGGVLTAPAVLFNGARPAWRFVDDSGASMGWLSTDPAGLPDGKNGEARVLGEMKLPESGHVSLAGGWNLGSEFVNALVEWAADRLSMLRDAGVAPWFSGEYDMESLLPAIGRGVLHFPKGSFVGDWETDGKRLVFSARVGHGVGTPDSPKK